MSDSIPILRDIPPSINRTEAPKSNRLVECRAGKTVAMVSALLIWIGVTLSPRGASANVEKPLEEPTQENLIGNGLNRVIGFPIGLIKFVVGGVEKIVSIPVRIVDNEAGKSLSDHGGENMSQGFEDVIVGGVTVGGFVVGGPAGGAGALLIGDSVMRSSKEKHQEEQKLAEEQERAANQLTEEEKGTLFAAIKPWTEDIEIPRKKRKAVAPRQVEAPKPAAELVSKIQEEPRQDNPTRVVQPPVSKNEPPSSGLAKTVHLSQERKDETVISPDPVAAKSVVPERLSRILDEQEGQRVVEEALSLAEIIGNQDKYVELAGGMWKAMNSDNVRVAIQKRLDPSYEEPIAEGPFAGQNISFVRKMREERKLLLSWKKEIESGNALLQEGFIVAMRKLALELKSKRAKAEEKFGDYFEKDKRPKVVRRFFEELEKIISTAQALENIKRNLQFVQVK